MTRSVVLFDPQLDEDAMAFSLEIVVAHLTVMMAFVQTGELLHELAFDRWVYGGVGIPSRSPPLPLRLLLLQSGLFPSPLQGSLAAFACQEVSAVAWPR
jgi:hypothetical protein